MLWLAATALSAAPLQRVREVESASRGLVVDLAVRVGEKPLPGGAVLRSRQYDGDMPGPTIRVRRGQLLEVRLRNLLGAEGGRGDGGNGIHSLNHTNLHLHGLRTAPGEFAVAEAVPPGGLRVYRQRIPLDAPPGLQWYHPHVHGATAVQVGGGMAGALVVEPEVGRLPGWVVVLQHVRYGEQLPAQSHARLYDYNVLAAMGGDGVGNVSGQGRGELVLANGELVPELALSGGGVRLQLLNAGASAALLLGVAGGGCDLALHGADGSPRRGGALQVPEVLLPPGGRADVRVTCRAAGRHLLESRAAVGGARRFLGDMTALFVGPVLSLVAGEGGDSEGAAAAALLAPELPDLFPAAAGLGAPRTMRFELQHHCERGAFCINGRPFAGGQIMVRDGITPGALHEWTFVNLDRGMNHPVHLHNHRLQVVRYDPPGAGWGATLGQYVDVLAIPSSPPEGELGSVTVRFLAAATHEGPSLMLHCHILAHEDLGMMTTIGVVQEGEPAHWPGLAAVAAAALVAVLAAGCLRNRHRHAAAAAGRLSPNLEMERLVEGPAAVRPAVPSRGSRLVLRTTGSSARSPDK